MKVEEADLKKINERMKGWVIDKVDSGGREEDVFIFHLSSISGTNKRRVILCANDLGGWIRPGG